MNAATTPAHEAADVLGHEVVAWMKPGGDWYNGFILAKNKRADSNNTYSIPLFAVAVPSRTRAHEAADRDSLALAHMTHEQFGQSMARWIALGRPLDQQTLDYIAAIYREVKE